MSDVIEAEAVEETMAVVPAAPAPPANLFRTDEPAEVLERATKTANALAPVLRQQNMLSSISGKDHVKIEGWTTLGSMLGVTAVGVWTRKMENGWEAKVNAQTLDGRVIGSAEAMCDRNEKRWASADEYAIRSMAQTRAASKALASVLRFVVTLAGFSGTPAEEMDGVSRGSNTSGGSPAPPSAKQVMLFERLAKENGFADTDLSRLMEWAEQKLTKRSISTAIEGLKGDGEQSAEETAQRLDKAAREWATQREGVEGEMPADREGLGASGEDDGQFLDLPEVE